MKRKSHQINWFRCPKTIFPFRIRLHQPCQNLSSSPQCLPLLLGPLVPQGVLQAADTPPARLDGARTGNAWSPLWGCQGAQLSFLCPILKEKAEARRQSFSWRTLLLAVTETIASFVWGQAASRDKINLEPQRGCMPLREELGFICFSCLVRLHLLHFSDEQRRLRKGR